MWCSENSMYRLNMQLILALIYVHYIQCKLLERGRFCTLYFNAKYVGAVDWQTVLIQFKSFVFLLFYWSFCICFDFMSCSLFQLFVWYLCVHLFLFICVDAVNEWLFYKPFRFWPSKTEWIEYRAANNDWDEIFLKRLRGCIMQLAYFLLSLLSYSLEFFHLFICDSSLFMWFAINKLFMKTAKMIGS